MGEFDPKFKQAHDRIIWQDWAPPKRGIFPEFRFAGRWWRVAWILAPALLLGLVLHVTAVWFIETEYGPVHFGLNSNSAGTVIRP
jgi:hypothetical protein